MNKQQKKNRRTIVLLFAMTIIPFSIAWFLSENAEWLKKGTNQGILITPPVITETSEFSGFDEFSTENMKELKGHWVLLNVLPNKDCNTVCQKAMHKTKQLRLMMNKDLTRIRRAVFIISDVDAEKVKKWWIDDVRLIRVKPAISLLNKLKTIRKKGIPDGMLLLMDPLGNLMMQYEPEFDPYEVKRDLRKLLRISQIG
jgi:hypothetical protein